MTSLPFTLICLVVLMLYGFTMNRYFGNNWTPQSVEEVICDGILVLGFLLVAIIGILEKVLLQKILMG